MELGLSLGNKTIQNHDNINNNNNNNNKMKDFCMGFGFKDSSNNNSSSSPPPPPSRAPPETTEKVVAPPQLPPSSPPRVQLDLLPFSPVPRVPQSLRFPWLSDNLSSEPGSSDGPGSKTMEVNRRVVVGEADEQSSPNSGTSSFMEFSLCTNNNNKKRENENNNNNNGQELIERIGVGVGVGGGGDETTTSRGSDDEENGLSSTRKKLRLSKEQSAFLEESFKEHHTLNPKQKLALAKELNLRPRQVEVWFQNRRARTKLKQTEVDCEYLKRGCETLTEENRRLQKELQELRALKTSQPFFMQLPATTLTMCPSCERVAPTSTTSTTTATVTVAAKPAIGSASITLSLGKPKPALPFSQVLSHKTDS